MTASTTPVRATGSQFAPLLSQVDRAGLLRRRRCRYALIIGTDALAFLTVWALIWVIGNTWWQIFLALPAGIFTVRMIFIGHDLGHQQVARTKRVNRWLGLIVGDLIVGLSSTWWIDKHTRHHANPNTVGRDPDVGDGLLCWTHDQSSGRRGISAWLSHNQGRLFFPLLLLEALNLHVGSLRATRTVRDAVLLCLHLAVYVGVLVVVMGPAKAAVFAAAHQALIGLHLGCAFAPNHKGMAMPVPGERWDFLRKQVLTSRDVRGGLATDWFLGGLNYQIEHHLFPHMPRPQLRHAQPLVKDHCAGLDIPYAETSLLASLALTARHLQHVGRPHHLEHSPATT